MNKPINRYKKQPPKTQQQIFETNEADTIASIVTYLNYSGWHCWRNNTYGIYDQAKQVYRKLQYQQKGVADIIGFHKQTAQFIAIEIKIGTDTTSPEQEEFLTQLKTSNGFAFIAHSFDDFLTKYERRKSKIIKILSYYNRALAFLKKQAA